MSWKALGAYLLLIAATVAGFLLIRHWGLALEPGSAERARGAAATAHLTSRALLHVLLALAAVVVTGGLLARVLRPFGQPPVTGEVLAGILLGPSLLGRLFPELGAIVMPEETAPYLGVVAQLGVVIYMFLVGVELDTRVLAGRAHAILATSHASIAAPFVLGAALALPLYPRLAPAGVPFTPFALFMGVAMSITAFPVLARILADRGLSGTPLGTSALACAASDDVTAWCLLALMVGVAQAELRDALTTILLAGGFVGLMIAVVRPLLSRVLPGQPASRGAAATLLTGMLVSAVLSEWIGIHAIFGAFLFGAVVPHHAAAAQAVREQVHLLATVVLLPAFFAFTGLRTRIDLVAGFDGWLVCAAIVVVATVGKFGGTWIAGVLTGMPGRDAARLGVLMNTRGLMELVVLNIGLDLGVISPTLFTMMVIMALVTTAATGPAMDFLDRRSSPR